MAKRVEVTFNFNFKYTATDGNEFPDITPSETQLENLVVPVKDLLDHKLRDILNIHEDNAQLEFTHS